MHERMLTATCKTLRHHHHPKAIRSNRTIPKRAILISISSSSRAGAHPPTPPPLGHNVLDTIGNTPLIRLDRFCKALVLPKASANNNKKAPTILAKLENTNPGMSKKDRIALEIIRQAKATGELKDGQAVVELTSGNTGAGLAIVCPLLGHPFCAVMSEGNSKERAQQMRFLGAEVVLVPQANTTSSTTTTTTTTGSKKNQVSGADLALVEEAAQRICQEREAFRVDQFHRQANADAHYNGTAAEILEQIDGYNKCNNIGDEILRIDGFVDFVGTGGSFAGCARRFKEALEDTVKCYIVEPAGITPLANKHCETKGSSHDNDHLDSISSKNHVIQGGGYDMADLALLDEVIEKGYVDGFLSVTNDEATSMARLLAKTEGIIGGFSTGANLHAAAEIISQGHATTVVALICDSGSKYYSANLVPDD